MRLAVGLLRLAHVHRPALVRLVQLHRDLAPEAPLELLTEIAVDPLAHVLRRRVLTFDDKVQVLQVVLVEDVCQRRVRIIQIEQPVQLLYQPRGTELHFDDVGSAVQLLRRAELLALMMGADSERLACNTQRRAARPRCFLTLNECAIMNESLTPREYMPFAARAGAAARTTTASTARSARSAAMAPKGGLDPHGPALDNGPTRH
uniref:Uncharacterized protein n=1 Tax=Phaeomonas parva TaxID=124430 RepID=A0A7S1UBP7_9STRA